MVLDFSNPFYLINHRHGTKIEKKLNSVCWLCLLVLVCVSEFVVSLILLRFTFLTIIIPRFCYYLCLITPVFLDTKFKVNFSENGLIRCVCVCFSVLFTITQANDERRQTLRHIDRLCKYSFATINPQPYINSFFCLFWFN